MYNSPLELHKNPGKSIYIRQVSKLRGEETYSQLLSRGRYLFRVTAAVGWNEEFLSPASPPIPTSGRGAQGQTVWVLPVDTSRSGPQFQYMKALNQTTSAISSDLCKSV